MEIPEHLSTFIPAWGSNWGYLGFHIIKCHLYLLQSAKKKLVYITGLRENYGRISFAFAFFLRGQQKPKDPNLSPVANNVITQSGIQGISVYICGLNSKAAQRVYGKNFKSSLLTCLNIIVNPFKNHSPPP